MQHIPPRGGDETTQLTKKPDRQGEGGDVYLQVGSVWANLERHRKVFKNKPNHQIFWPYFI
jgi:hypothetical protein